MQAISSLGISVPSQANVTCSAATITLTAAMCTKYGIDASHAGEKIHPYAAKHYNRPIPYNFLDQINNADEFGTNGY